MYDNEHSLYGELSISDDETPKVTPYPHQHHFFTAYQANMGERKPSQRSALPYLGNAKLMALLRRPRPEVQATRSCFPWRKKEAQLTLSDLPSDVINHILTFLLDEPRNLAALAGTNRFLLQHIIQSMDTEALGRIYPLLEIIRKSGLKQWISEGRRKKICCVSDQNQIALNYDSIKHLYDGNMSALSIDMEQCSPNNVKSLVLQLEFPVKLSRIHHDYCSDDSNKYEGHIKSCFAFGMTTTIVGFALMLTLDDPKIGLTLLFSGVSAFLLYAIIFRCAKYCIKYHLNNHYDISQIIEGVRLEIQERNRQSIRQKDTADERTPLLEAIERDVSVTNSSALSRGSLFPFIESRNELFADDDNDSIADLGLNA